MGIDGGKFFLKFCLGLEKKRSLSEQIGNFCTKLSIKIRLGREVKYTPSAYQLNGEVLGRKGL